MANKIQIKRSVSTASVSGLLSNGELAFTQASNTLWIGLPDGSGVLRIGGAQAPGVLTANHALVANSTSAIDKVIVANLVPTVVWANGAAGTGGQVLTSNSSGGAYWSSPTSGVAGADTQVQFNDGGSLAGDAGFTYNKTTDSLTVANVISIGSATVNSTNFSGTANNSSYLGGTIASSYALKTYADTAYSNALADTLSRSGSYTGNNIIGGTNTVFSSNVTVSASKIYAYSADVSVNTIAINSTLIVNGNVTLGNNNTGDTVTFTSSIASNIMPSANITHLLGNNSMRWSEIHAANVHSTKGYFDGNVEIGGDLFVTGNVVTTNVASVVVSDPMIYLAGNNYTSDLLDIGFAGNYNDGTNRHAGMFRDSSDGGLFKLFYNLTQELAGNNVVDVTDATYRIATLNAYLSSGGLSTNGTHVAITANSTVNVVITANTLTLSTALAGTSGGIGHASYTAEDILVANSSNGFRKLSLGTDGYVLQSNGSALIYDVLDGGNF